MSRLALIVAIALIAACGESAQLSELCAKPSEGKPILACSGYQQETDIPLPAQG